MMRKISAADVQSLRQMTGAGMMDCKQALAENDGDQEKAVDWLRKKGIAKASSKASRDAKEGLVCLAVDGSKGALVSVRSETDFVARNETFQEFVRVLGAHALGHLKEGDGTNELAALDMEGEVLKDKVIALAGTIGENISLGECVLLEGGTHLGHYLHNAVDEALGRIGVMVTLESSVKGEALQLLGKQLAMHIAAMKPLALTRAAVPQDAVAREQDILMERARASGKPDNIAEKMVTGGMDKWYKETVLMEQKFIMDDSLTIEAVLDKASAEMGGAVSIIRYARLAVGDS